MKCIIIPPDFLESLRTVNSNVDFNIRSFARSFDLMIDEDAPIEPCCHYAVLRNCQSEVHLADNLEVLMQPLRPVLLGLSGRTAFQHFQQKVLSSSVFTCSMRKGSSLFRVSKGVDTSDRCLLFLRIYGNERTGFVYASARHGVIQHQLNKNISSFRSRTDVIALLEPGQSIGLYFTRDNGNGSLSYDEHGSVRWTGKYVVCKRHDGKISL